jgi:acetyltransferase-like isoleucine patch superfamily enzyme
MARLRRLWEQPLSRRLQYASWLAAKCKTQSFYRWRLQSCGSRSIVRGPLFWTPEYITLGDDVLIWQGCRIEGVDIPGRETRSKPHISFGDGVTVEQNCHFTSAGHMQIAAGTTILFDVMITDIDHGYKVFGTRVIDQPMEVNATRIGRNCFIGSGARILAGTTLGDSCVVGANAVVRGSFPDGAVIAGNPARVVKRYDADSKSWIKAEPA